jgi:cell division protein FtsW (lipid II flippase)
MKGPDEKKHDSTDFAFPTWRELTGFNYCLMVILFIVVFATQHPWVALKRFHEEGGYLCLGGHQPTLLWSC